MKVKQITLSVLVVNFVHATIYPERRFIKWSTLTSSEQGDANTLGYTSTTWNTPGTAAFESSASYDTLSSNAQESAATFGLNEEGKKTTKCKLYSPLTFSNSPTIFNK